MKRAIVLSIYVVLCGGIVVLTALAVANDSDVLVGIAGMLLAVLLATGLFLWRWSDDRLPEAEQTDAPWFGVSQGGEKVMTTSEPKPSEQKGFAWIIGGNERKHG